MTPVSTLSFDASSPWVRKSATFCDNILVYGRYRSDAALLYLGPVHRRLGNPTWEIAVLDAFQSNHPTAEVLRAYSLCRLDDASAGAVASHVEQCEECQRLVAEIAPDPFL